MVWAIIQDNLYMHTRSITIEDMIDTFNYIKIEDLCSLRIPIKRMKMKGSKQQNIIYIYYIYIYNIYIYKIYIHTYMPISRIQKELLQINKKKSNIQQKLGHERPEPKILKREYPNAQ